jgi:hypothetical protein
LIANPVPARIPTRFAALQNLPFNAPPLGMPTVGVDLELHRARHVGRIEKRLAATIWVRLSNRLEEVAQSKLCHDRFDGEALEQCSRLRSLAV